jgi:hypothetical protein
MTLVSSTYVLHNVRNKGHPCFSPWFTFSALFPIYVPFSIIILVSLGSPTFLIIGECITSITPTTTNTEN